MMTEHDAPRPDDPCRRSRTQRRRPRRRCGRVTLLLSLLLMLLHCWQHYTGAPEWRADLYLAVPAVQLLMIVIIVYRCLWPQTKGDLVLFLLGNVLVTGNAVLFYYGQHLWWSITIASVGLRIGIAGMWLMGATGVCLLAVTIRKNTLKWHRLAPRWLLAGLSSLLAIILAESAAALLEPAPTTYIRFPELQKTNDDTLTIAALGGSSMKGFPYPPGFGMTEVAVRQLQHSIPEVKTELHNLAITGQNLAQAISQLKQLESAPDIIVVYSGHNEFFHDLEEMSASRRIRTTAMDQIFRWSPTFRVINPVLSQYQLGTAPTNDASSMFRHAICTDEVAARRLARFKSHFDRLLKWADERETEVVLCVPAKDLATFEPNACVSNNLNQEDRSRIEAGVAQVRRLQQDNEHQQATQTARRLLESFPSVPELHFRLGQSLLVNHHADQAETHFIRATDLDQFPTRIRPDYEAAIRQAAIENNVPLIDAPTILKRYTRDGVCSDDLFLDGVHPNTRATYILGMHIEQQLRNLIQPDSSGNPERIKFAEMMRLLETDSGTLRSAYEECTRVLQHYAGFRSWDPQERLQRGDLYRRLVVDLKSGTGQSGESGIESLEADVPLPTLFGQNND